MTKNQEVEVEYHKNGNKKHERHIKDGELDGVSTYWKEDGSETEVEYVSDVDDTYFDYMNTD